MNSRKQTRAEAILKRMSFGAVPVGGVYWVDPRAVRAAMADRSEQALQPAPKQSTQSSSCEHALAPEATS
jgi:hypothetical protein